ncbi:tripartite motif-containing protein 26-like [Strongylocentrotus purpuratus]|uniref:Uncharacterized protein n=1 Tax=Strongylocentrotus purpuratus TaxID=7668 RepID=A0A7M7N0X3_STRPU|nr:tripartite motif-containing protein 26-like [Strongylocentrotus purpuratus]
MASSKKDHLVCPVCIDIIEDATILNCGHTFCRECLEEIYISGVRLSCPVCRAKTTLTVKGVEGLPRNVIINSLADDYQKSLNSAKACPFHKEHEKEFFCQECKVHICIRCVVTGHLNHQMKTKEDFEREIKEKVDCLMERGQAKKADMERVIASAEAPKAQVASAVVNLERCIKNEYARKRRLLKENTTSLLEEISTLQRRYDSSIDVDTMPYKQVVQDINRALAVIRVKDLGSLEADSLASHTMVCNDLDELLNEVLAKTDADVTRRSKEAVMNATFHPFGDGLLNLGMVKTRKKKMKVVRDVQLSRLALAAQSEDSPSPVKVENGAWQSWSHVNRINECDDECRLITEANEDVKDLECDEDDDEFGFKDVVELHPDYNGDEYGGFTEADSVESSECDDDEFGFNQVDIVEVPECDDDECGFTEADCVDNLECDGDEFGFPEDDYHTRPRQVAVTSSGVIIVSTCDITPSTVTVFGIGKNSALGSFIKTTGENEFHYAAVDSKDQVLIA